MTAKKSDTANLAVLALLYILSAAILWSPYFTPVNVIGPEGILRGDQIIIPLMIITVAFVFYSQFTIPLNMVVVSLLLLVLIIPISIFSNFFIYGGQTEINDLYNFIIWTSYLGLFIVVAGNIPSKYAKKTITLIIALLSGIAILAWLQWLGFPLTTDTVASIYTTRLDRVGREPTATTHNPNILGKIILIPLFFSFAQLYRAAMVNKPLFSIAKWATLFILFSTTLVISGSRGSLIGAVFGFGVVSLILLFERIGDSVRRLKVISGFILCAFIGLFTAIFILEIGRIANLQSPLDDNSLQIRFNKWETVLPLLLDRPLLGYGPSKTAQLEVGVTHIDSGYLIWWYHYGLVGITAFTGIVLGSIRAGTAVLVKNTTFENEGMLWSTAVAVVGWFVASIVIAFVVAIPTDRRTFTFVLFVTALLISMKGSSKPPDSAETERQNRV